MVAFHSETARVFRTTGWTLISGDVASRYFDVPNFQLPIRAIIRQLDKSGRTSYEVRQGRSIIARGEESHPAYAAMESNEQAWTVRDALQKIAKENA